MVTPNNIAAGSVAAPAATLEKAAPSNLHEALGLFVADKEKWKERQETHDGHQEIIRFIDWYGRDRKWTISLPACRGIRSRIFAAGSRSAKAADSGKGISCLHKKDGMDRHQSCSPFEGQPGPALRFRAPDCGEWAVWARLSEEGYNRLLAELDKYKVEKVKADQEVKEPWQARTSGKRAIGRGQGTPGIRSSQD